MFFFAQAELKPPVNYTALIVEDNPVDAELLQDYLHKYFPEITVAASTASVRGIKALVNQHLPQMVFMDIELVDGQSLEVLDSLNTEEIQLIFITSHNVFAIDAIRANAVDYIVKPVDAAVLKKAVLKAFHRLEIINAAKQNTTTATKKIPIPTADGLVFIDIENIIRIEASGAYAHFILHNAKPLLVSRNLGSFEKELPHHLFMRIHDSCIVNRIFITEYIRHKNGGVKMADGTLCKLSPNKKDSFLSWMQADNRH